MLRQGVWAVIALLSLLLFSASAALACSECSCESGHCLVSLEYQTGEVLCADLEAVSDLDLDAKAEPFYANAMNNAAIRSMGASGAAGVLGGIAEILRNDLACRSDTSAALRPGGRFLGAGV